MMRYGILALALAAALLAAGTDGAIAGPATVEGVEVRQEPSGTWRFDVTVRHADTGWDHYANAFTVTTVDGAPLGTRTLFHPHVEEQPFTRSLNGVAIPDGVTEVLVRAVDSVHGEGEPVRVLLNQ